MVNPFRVNERRENRFQVMVLTGIVVLASWVGSCLALLHVATLDQADLGD